MGVLEQVTQLKKQGMEDNQIIQNLQQQGLSPKAIQDALGQAQVKDAVSSNEQQQDNMQDMQPSIMQQEQNYDMDENSNMQAPQNPNMQQQNQPYSYQPQTQELGENPQAQNYYQPQQAYPQQNFQPQNYEQEYYSPGPEQGYSNYDAYQPQQSTGFDTDLIIEIAEQVFTEKIKILEQQIHQTNEFKTITYAKLENLAMRLKKIESIIDKLEISILGKIGDYGKGIQGIKKEMQMMQDSFSKALPDLAKSKHKKHSTKHKK